MKWTKEWPKAVGYYWFYGFRFKLCDPSEELELSFVEVRKDSTRKPFYVTRGHFLYRAEGADGVWQNAFLPKLP